MTYSQLFTHRQPRIPIVGLLIVVVVVIFFLARWLSVPVAPSKASEHIIEDLSIVNINAHQAGIVWKTKTKTTGWVMYGDTSNDQQIIALDERDVSEKKYEYTVHYVLIRNLLEDKSYYFKIVNNNQLLGDSQNKPFSFKTISAFVSSASTKPAYGKVMLPNGSPLVNGIVMVSLDNAYPLVALTKESGEWLASLNSVVDFTSNKRKDLKDSDKVVIQIQDGDQRSTIKSSVSTASPLPQTIVLGNDYDFTQKNNVLGATDVKSEGRKDVLYVSYPKEGSVIPGTFPLIKGTAPVGSTVKITLGGPKSYTFSALTDNKGEWSLSTSQTLSAGEYTLSALISGSQASGILVERHFSIAKSGEQVLGEATGEATPTVIVTQPPSVSTNPSPTSSSSSATIQPTTPVTGSSPVPIVAISGVLILIGAGMLLAF